MKKRIYLLYISVLVLLLTGCANDNSHPGAENNEQIQPVRYQQQNNRQENSSDDSRSRYKQARISPSMSSYNEAESKAFQNLIKEHMEIEDVQVVTTRDRVVVAIRLDTETNEAEQEEIRRDIEEILQTDKELVVYNNVPKWEQMKDFYQRKEADQTAEDIEHLFQKLFE